MATQQQVNVRKTQRTALTNHIKLVETLDTTTMTREEYFQCSERLKEIKQYLEDNHLDIVIAFPDEQSVEKEAEDHQRYIEKIFYLSRFLASAERNIKVRESEEQTKKEQEAIISTANAQAQAMALHPITAQPIQMKLAKLPETSLPKFTGKCEDWLTFADRFVHTIHTRKDLSGSEKLKYLQASLQGEAACIIEHLSINDSNYFPAWETVKNKYHHEREIVFNHLDIILDQPTVPQSSISALEKLKSDCNNSFTALKSLQREVTLGEDFIVKIILRQMDAETRKDFKKSLQDRDVPSLKSLKDFIDKVVADPATKSSQSRASSSSHSNQHSRNPDLKFLSKPSRPTSFKCSFCQGEHFNYSCKKRLEKPAADRLSFAKESKVCTNCLSPSHSTKECLSKKTCNKCSKNHHTLLHKDTQDTTNKPKSSVNAAQITSSSISNPHTILATAIVQIKNKYEQAWECRALIDNGSTHTFVNSSLVKTLGLNKQLLPTPMVVNGLADTPIITVTHTVDISLTSEHYPDTVVTANALVVEKASGLHPSVPVDPQGWSHTKDLTLADPKFFKSRSVNVLLGANIYPRILHGGMRKGSPNQPLAQDTMFRWIISGPTISSSPNLTISSNNNCALEITLRKFWEIENCPSATKILNREEQLCEDHYQRTTRRRTDGSFEVHLPFKDNQPPLGNSKCMAYKRFLNLEAKFQKNPAFKEQYRMQIEDLIKDGHLEPVPEEHLNPQPSKSYFLPHHE